MAKNGEWWIMTLKKQISVHKKMADGWPTIDHRRLVDHRHGSQRSAGICDSTYVARRVAPGCPRLSAGVEPWGWAEQQPSREAQKMIQSWGDDD